MSKTGLGWNEQFPHIPKKMSTRSDSGCSGCPLTGVHPTCGSAAPAERPLDSELISLSEIRSVQWRLTRKNVAGEGIKAADGDTWALYRARDTEDYVLAISWVLVSVDETDPSIITIERISDQDPRDLFWNQYTFPVPDDLTGLTRADAKTHCSLTPGIAFLAFSENSKLWDRAIPAVVEIISQDHENSRLTVKTDHDCSAALNHLDDEDESDIIVTSFQYCSLPGWQYVVKPDYFYGERKTLNIEAGAVPSEPIDGVYVLEAEAPVMDENGFDPLDPTFTFEGQRIDDSTWETVPQHTQRLFVLPNKAYIAFKDLRPADGLDSITLADDLTETYSRFRITYYKLTDGTSGSCKIVGYSRCRWSMPANGAGVENYGPGDGIGNDYYCAKRRYDSDPSNIDLEDLDEPPDGIRETSKPWVASARGVSRYPENGLCQQKNCCDFWESAARLDARDAPWKYEKMINRVFHEATGATYHRVYQPLPGVDDWQIEVIQHPSIAQLAGYYRLDTPEGQHPQAKFSGVGTWGWPETVDDYPVAGDQSIVIRLGAFHNFNEADPETAGDGQIPSRYPDFKTKRDPLNQAAMVSDPEPEMMGVGVERDTGVLLGHGPAQASLAVTAQDLVFAPNVDITLTDTLISKQFGSFQRFSDESDAELRLLPLRQELKSEETIGTRETAATPTDQGDGVTKLEFKNVTHSWSTVVGSGGGATDAVVSWKGGGDPATFPPDPQREIINYYEPNKSTGGKNRGVAVGDGMRVLIDGVERTFVVISRTAHGGSSSGTWDGTTPEDGYAPDGDYTSYGQLQDVCEVYDPDGELLSLSADTTVTFIRNAVVMLPGGVLQWTEYQSDNWQDVDSITLHSYGDGLWHIADSWFADKPDKICFRVKDCRWVDHRGIVPATLYNKLSQMVDGLDWVNGGMVNTTRGAFSLGLEISQSWTRFISGIDCSEVFDEGDVFSTEFEPTDNLFLIEQGDIDGDSTTSRVTLAITSDAMGIPAAMRFFPPGTIIHEAIAQISGGTITRERTIGDDPPFTTVGEMDCHIVGFNGPKDFNIIATLPGAGENQSVVDFTDAARAMLEHCSTGEYAYGYGLIYSPVGLDDNATNLQDWLPGEGPFEYTTIAEGFPCAGTPSPKYKAGFYDRITWSEPSISRVAMRVTFPESDRVRHIVMPMWPSMADAVPAGLKMYEDGTTAPL